MYSIMISATECQDRTVHSENSSLLWGCRPCLMHSLGGDLYHKPELTCHQVMYLPCSDRFQFFILISYQSPQNIIRLQRHAKLFWGEKSQRKKGLPNYIINRKTKALKSWALLELYTPFTASSLQLQRQTVCYPPVRKAGSRINTFIFPSLLIVHTASHYT